MMSTGLAEDLANVFLPLKKLCNNMEMFVNGMTPFYSKSVGMDQSSCDKSKIEILLFLIYLNTTVL